MSRGERILVISSDRSSLYGGSDGLLHRRYPGKVHFFAVGLQDVAPVDKVSHLINHQIHMTSSVALCSLRRAENFETVSPVAVDDWFDGTEPQVFFHHCVVILAGSFSINELVILKAEPPAVPSFKSIAGPFEKVSFHLRASGLWRGD